MALTGPRRHIGPGPRPVGGAGGGAEARGGWDGGAGCTDGGAGQRPPGTGAGTGTRTGAAAGPHHAVTVRGFGRLLLHLELHQVKVVHVVHSQGTGGEATQVWVHQVRHGPRGLTGLQRTTGSTDPSTLCSGV